MIFNITNQSIIASQPYIAKSYWTRTRGMIANSFTRFDALILPRTGSIHTAFMSISLDLIFTDVQKRILKIVRDVPPWRVQFGPSGCENIIELPNKTLGKVLASTNDILSWRES